MAESLGIYVHLPFCLRKCRYCDFVSYPVSLETRETEELFRTYLQAVRQEAAWYHCSLGETRAATVYLGGGTPSLLSPELLADFLSELRDFFPWEEGAEVTLEANPGTVTLSQLKILRETGINRLSVGVQSFADRDLRTLGRIHGRQEALAALRMAKEAGFTNISADLIFAIPGQSLEGWEENLREAVALGIPHLSVYNLTLEEGTPLQAAVARGEEKLPEEEVQVEMFLRADSVLVGAGYHHYEIANFALPGFVARHNLRYWENLPYLGLGAGAWGYLWGVRYGNYRELEEYLAVWSSLAGARDGAGRYPAYPFLSPAVGEVEDLPPPRRWGEAMMLALRTTWGVEVESFRRRYGIDPLRRWSKEIRDLVEKGWLEVREGRLRLTLEGMLWANQVALAFLPN